MKYLYLRFTNDGTVMLNGSDTSKPFYNAKTGSLTVSLVEILTKLTLDQELCKKLLAYKAEKLYISMEAYTEPQFTPLFFQVVSIVDGFILKERKDED